MRIVRSLLLGLALALGIPASGRADPSGLAWQPFADAVFARARAENRYVLLHMAAVWCHWCHVMEGTTYRDPAVRDLIDRRFIPVRVDQDSRPDLSYRYERWGWPATIMFDADGNEIFKRQGYLPPELFAKLLQAVIDDPSALPSTDPDLDIRLDTVQLSAEQRAGLDAILRESYDAQHGGFGDIHRFLQPEAVEWALLRGRDGQPPYAEMAKRTLDNARKLIDPVWGGMYQYSDRLDWSGPHYEKLMNIQLAALRLYGLQHASQPSAEALAAATAVYRYLMNHLRSPEGAFYTSQDADVDARLTGQTFYALPAEGRARVAAPAIDRNRYARENGWAIMGLTAYYDATGETEARAAAVGAADWVLAHRRTPGGGFGHGSAADADAYLADNIAMAEAFLALHRSTGARRWLDWAARTARYVAERFRDEGGGFHAQRPPADARGVLQKPVKQLEENVTAVRVFNLLSHYLGDPQLLRLAEHGMSYLAAFAELEGFFPGILLADHEIGHPPVHVAVVGGKDDPKAAALYAAARAYPARYLRIEWWDRREGPLPNADVRYPELPESAAFACADKLCSLPVFAADEVAQAVARVDRR